MRLKSRLKQWWLSRRVRPIEWRGTDGLPLACIVGAHHVPMLAHALASLKRCEPRTPPLIVAADSPESMEGLRGLFSPRSRLVSLRMWDDDIGTVPVEWRGFVERYLRHPRWGCMAKKFVFLSSLNRQHDFVYADSDMLWYGGVLDDVRARLEASPSGFCVAPDAWSSYDTAFLDHVGFSFSSPVPMNAGFLALRCGRLVAALGHERLAGWHRYEGPFGVHTEQTLVVCAADCVAGETLPSDMVGISMEDGGAFTRRFTPRVRHYVGPKTLFWRDC